MKKARTEKNIVEDLIEMDRMLVMAVKRNLGVVRRMADQVQDDRQKETLTRFLGKHVLLPAEKPKETVEPILTEGEKKLNKLSRYMEGLTEDDFSNLLLLVKAMSRHEKSQVPKAEGSDGPAKEKKRGKSKGAVVAEDGGAPISGAAAANPSGSDSEQKAI